MAVILARLEWPPSAREGGNAKQTIMAKQHEDEQNGRRPEAPAEDFNKTKPVAAGDHGCKWNVGRCIGKCIPCRTELPLALAVNGHGAEEGQNEKCREKNRRCFITVGYEMKSRPEGNPPKKRVTGDAQNAARSRGIASCRANLHARGILEKQPLNAD